MKKFLSMMLCLWSLCTWAQQEMVSDTMMVRGNCGMCKATIEEAVQQEPTASGIWDKNSKVLTVIFDEEQTSLSKIMRKVAKAGYDNQMFTAEDEAYEQLPGCCLYDRETPWENIENKHLEGCLTEGNEHEEHFPEEENAIQLENVVAEGSDEATSLDAESIGLTYQINEEELTKAACCNLSESFETNATVDVNYANAVTGTKQIKMLGLDQKYILVTKELLPEIRGLGTAHGMNFIPGRWIQGIQLTKGGSTVTNGYESISGQINTELYKTYKKEKTLINLFANFQSRLEGNIVHTDTISTKWSQSVLAHGSTILERMDNNDDGFMDQPIGRQINTTYLLNYNDIDDSGIATHFGINFLDDHHISGQMNFIEDSDQLTTNNYGVGIDISRFQFWNKTGYVFKDKPYQSIGLMNQFTYYEQDSYFGLTSYNGIQKTYYTNLIFESILGNTFHKYKTGASFLYDVYDEQYREEVYARKETVPGIFFEYTYSGEKFVAVAGARVDFHNLAGTQFTPRLNLKYDVTENTVLRASAGRGFRTANVFAESQAYLASNRSVQIVDSDGDIYGLDPEIAWNYGVSAQQEFRLFGNKSTLVADYFITHFENQILPDLDASPQQILFYNMDGDSYARSFQIQWDVEPIKRLEMRLAYKNYDTQANYASGKKEIPFTARNRGFLNLAYSTFKNGKGQQWTFDTTLQWVGKQRIPDTSSNPQAFQLPTESPSYFLWNAQVARQMSKVIRLYSGVENILSYTQDHPIVDAQNPFSHYFDGGMVYAPIMPANLYIGLDITF